jgi:RNA polymerase sigma-70 factor (family 1)
VKNNEKHIDKDLFNRIAKGDEAAFTQIFYNYTTKLAPFVMSLLHSNVWTEEIVQDVFLNLWQHREHLEQVDNPQAYIYQIAYNRTLDYIKKNERQIKLQYALAHSQAAADTNFTDLDLNFRATDQLVKEAVSQMPAQRRVIYQLAREQGLSQQEIADQLSISRHTVRNHMAEALKDIREYLQGHGTMTAILLWTFKNIF